MLPPELSAACSILAQCDLCTQGPLEREPTSDTSNPLCAQRSRALSRAGGHAPSSPTGRPNTLRRATRNYAVRLEDGPGIITRKAPKTRLVPRDKSTACRTGVFVPWLSAASLSRLRIFSTCTDAGPELSSEAGSWAGIAHGSDTPRSEAVRRCEGAYVTYSPNGARSPNTDESVLSDPGRPVTLKFRPG